MKSLHYLQSIASIGCIAVLITLIVTFQLEHDKLSPPFTTKLAAVTRNLLPANTLPHITFGFKNIITDIYWIRAVQDLPSWNGKDLFYLNYFKNISTLDPTFEYPYLFSILVVPQRQNTKLLNIEVLHQIATISEKGIQSIPTSWKIPFYLGTQFYLFTKKYDPAEHYLGIAASRKGAPDGVYLVYSSFVAKTVAAPIHSPEDYATAQSLIKVIYNNTDNETIKKIIAKGLQENLINQMLEKGIAAYHTKYKKYPKTVNDMLSAHLVSFPPELLENFTVTINQRDGSYKLVAIDQEEQ